MTNTSGVELTGDVLMDTIDQAWDSLILIYFLSLFDFGKYTGTRIWAENWHGFYTLEYKPSTKESR